MSSSPASPVLPTLTGTSPTNPSMDASIVIVPNNSPSSDDLEALLQEALGMEEEQPPVAKEKDAVVRYHELIRRALVDWGDDIIDTLCKKFGKSPKLVAHIESVRKEMIDPLRDSLA